MTVYLVGGSRYEGGLSETNVEAMVSNERAARALAARLRRDGCQDSWWTPVEVHGTAKAARESLRWPLDR